MTFKRSWPHLRAAFVLFHLTAITLMALPAPGGGLDRQQWADPTVQAEFRLWNQRLDGLGVHMTQAQFEDRLYAAAHAIMDVREVALTPFKPYYKYCATNQSWRMFVAPHTYPERLHIEVKEGGEWRTVYVERDPTATWRGYQLDHDRMRSAIFRFGWRKYRTSYVQFADWTARQAAVDFPEATEVRLRYWKQRSPSAAEVRRGFEPEGDWDDVLVRTLRKVP